MFRRFATALVAVASLLGTSWVLAPSAQAAARNGLCESGEFCLYYGSGRTGSMVDTVNTIRDYGTSSSCVKFVRAGTGRGLCVKNRAASAWNRTGGPVYVYYNSDFGGVYDVIPNGAGPNLNANVNKDNASQIVGEASLRFPLAVSQATIKNHNPAWCWNSKANCHHDYNAADIFANTGTRIVSPVAGKVMTVHRGDVDTSSTATVKDRFGRLWFFQHMWHGNGGVQVRVGQTVAKGTTIGYVGNRAQAFGTDPHLHIDMRVGVDSRVSCSRAACAGYGFVNNQPMLRTAFLALP